jgi:hypothetical protein
MESTWHLVLDSVSKKQSSVGPKFLKLHSFQNSSSISSRNIGRIRATIKAWNRSREIS